MRVKNSIHGMESMNDELEAMFLGALNESLNKLSDEEKKRVLKKIKQKDYNKLVNTFINSTSDVFVQQIKKANWWHRYRENRYASGFKKRLRKNWSGYIDEYELLIQLCVESMTRLRVNIGDTRKNDKHLGLLIRVHARCLRISNEVLTLALNGYGDAALARWRALHESAVTLSAIAEIGKKSSTAFIAFNTVESHKAMQAFNTFAPQLGQKKFTISQINAAKKKRDKAVTKYGKDIEEPYGWADMYTANKVRTFSDLEKEYGQEFMRPYYRWASYSVHTNVKTIFGGEQEDALKEAGVVLIGPSDRGFEDALQLSALTLAKATISVLARYPNYENTVMAAAILKYERITSKTFAEYFNKNQST